MSIYTNIPAAASPLYKNGMQHHGKEIFLTKRWRTRQRSTQFHEESKIDYRRFASEPTPIFCLAGIRTCYCKYWKKIRLAKKKRTNINTLLVFIFFGCLTPSALLVHTKTEKKTTKLSPKWLWRAVGRWMEIGSWQEFLKVEASPRSLRWGWMDGLDMIGWMDGWDPSGWLVLSGFFHKHGDCK